MNFKLSEAWNCEDIVNLLPVHLPEFSFDFDDEPYLTSFELGQFIVSNMNVKPVLRKALDFSFSCIEKGTSEMQDMIVLEILTQIFESEKAISATREILRQSYLKVFEEELERYKS